MADSVPHAPAEYTVVARRYRPRQFDQLVGQEPVARALQNALATNRVAHAYLFTGARGVGKTSTARILAKALNCERGPTPKPCDQCEACKAIAAGEDIDVLEIDGASNNGVDEVRSVRQNAATRPGRSRYKIYIIDEVHMLSRGAFNALLKTLEEPPPHVKFILATTEVHKIPDTILSRCQRFDFGTINPQRILEHLRAIVAGEGRQADDAVLALLARRANGSMRDAESLLDQLLAFGGERLTMSEIHALLGTAAEERVLGLAGAVLDGEVAQALAMLSACADEGLQLGELLDQLIEYWRDLMLVRAAGTQAPTLNVMLTHRETLVQQARRMPLDTILAGLDILTSVKARLRGSLHARVLLEMALVRLARLDELLPVTQLVQYARQPGTAPPPTGGSAGKPTPRSVDPPEGAKKKPPEPSSATEAAVSLSEENLAEHWPRILAQLTPMLAREMERGGIPAIPGPKTLALRFPAEYNHAYEFCNGLGQVQKLEQVLLKATGQPWTVRLEKATAPANGVNGHANTPGGRGDRKNGPGGDNRLDGGTRVAGSSGSHRTRRPPDVLQEPLLAKAVEVLGASLLALDDGFGAVTAPKKPPALAAEGEEDI